MMYIGLHHDSYHLRQQPIGTIHRHLCLCKVQLQNSLLFLLEFLLDVLP